MTVEPIVVAGLVALIAVAAFVNGMIGFGFALLAVNALAFVLDARNGVIAMSLITPMVSGLQAFHHRDQLAIVGRLRPLLATALLGSIVGTLLLVSLPAPAISLALGVFTIWFALDSMRKERPPMSGGTERWLGPVAGVLGGISNGALGASGPVFGTYLTAIGLRGAAFAFGISSAFFLMSLLRLGLLGVLGQYTSELVLIGLSLAVPAVLAQRIGFWMRGRLSAAVLFRAVLAVLFVAGANLVVRAVDGLIS